MKTLPLLAEVPRLTVEYLRVVVEGYTGGVRINPTTFVVQFAYTPNDGSLPNENMWVDGDWDTSNTTYMARGLYGPGTGAALAAGDWVAWVRIVSNPETPVRRLGILRIT